MKSKAIPIILVLLVAAFATLAQTTQFSYQGSLNDGGNPANGNYDFEFVLFGALSGGTQLGPTNTRNAVAVTNGVFSVFLDFGNQFSAGDNRWLEIRARPTGQPGFTILSPRQPLTTVPYAWKSQEASIAGIATNAAQLGGVAANQFVQTGDARLSDARNPLPNSPNYIQNTTVQQVSSNFNISGSGYIGGWLDVANSVNVSNSYSIGGLRVLSRGGTSNFFAGVGAGLNNSGAGNAFFGSEAGTFNSTGFENSFFGSDAGYLNETGIRNTFFGYRAGRANVIGQYNAFFGTSAGAANQANRNSFFGAAAGMANSGGAFNSFFGADAGTANIEGSFNSFFGKQSGTSNVSGSNNAFFGIESGFSSLTGNDNSFFGAYAGRSNNNGTKNSFFGFDAGRANTIGDNNAFFGEGAGRSNISGSHNTFVGFRAGYTNTAGSWNTAVGYNANIGPGNLTNATAIGDAAYVTQSDSLVLGSINGINGAGASINVGIGTTAPKAKLHIAGGSIFIAQPNSLIITAPNGSCWFITVSNTGTLSTISVACP